MKYNYILFNTADSSLGKRYDGYYSMCVSDLEKHPKVHVVSTPLDYGSMPIRILYRLYHIRRYFSLPFQHIWYPFYFKNPFPPENPLCFIVLGSYCSVSYLRWLKQTYPQARVVKLHRDLVELWRRNMPEFTEEVCKELFDLRFSYDEQEARKYNLIACSDYASKVDISSAKEYPLSDVFFAGRVKDRLPRLMKAYKIFTEAGLQCSYYLTGVSQKARQPFPGIIYADKQMPYREMLYRTVNSRCVLEISQGGEISYTSRFMDAVIYGKKLITTNASVKNTKFYNPQYIQCVENVCDIRPEFIMTDVGTINYHYNNEFSPIHLIEQIDKELIRLDIKEGRA